MKFKATHRNFSLVLCFTEDTAPDWLTCKDTVKGSTMDDRWFWTDRVLTLQVGQSVNTDFWKLERTE